MNALNFNHFDEQRKAKMHSDERQVVLKRIEGKNVTSDTGLIDNRAYTGGGNNLRIMKVPGTTMWTFRQEKGITPEPLKQMFTGVRQAKQFASSYFKKRGLELVEFLDA